MLHSFLHGNKNAKYDENARFRLHLEVDAKLTTLNKITRNLFAKQANSDSYKIPEGKNHNIKRSHSKRWSKTSACEIGNYFWDNPIRTY